MLYKKNVLETHTFANSKRVQFPLGTVDAVYMRWTAKEISCSYNDDVL